MTSSNRVEIVELPETKKEINLVFKDKGLRKAAYNSALFTGRVLLSGIALTTSGRASAKAVDIVAQCEFKEKGYDKCRVGEGDPLVYAPGVAVAYLDQPLDCE